MEFYCDCLETMSGKENLEQEIFKTMAVGIICILTLLSVARYSLREGDREDADMQELLRQRQEQLRQEVTSLLTKMAQRRQERCSFAAEGVLLAAGWHWWLWAPAEALLLLLGLRRLRRQSSADGDSGSQRGSASDAEERREREEDCEGRAEPGATLRADKTLEKAGSSAAPAKQARPKNSFLTGPRPASGRGSAYECPQTKIRKRPLLAPPSPPLGHSVRQRWAPRGICRRRAAAPPGAPDGERAAPPPLPREQLNGSRVPAARAASAPLRRDAPPVRRRVRGSLNTPEKYYIIVNK
ncbi:uncharacterized protein LOC141972885 [Athene noctua]|uniref:uncharacterized protein LOC141972885 n=1 Tax=Athene noctua TaxID=126797 RepID=UPI003EBCFCF8